MATSAEGVTFGQLSSGNGKFPKLFEPQNASQLEAYVKKTRPSKVRQVAGLLSPTEMADSVTSAFKKGFDKVSEVVAPKTPKPSGGDSLSLSNDIKPGPELYLAVARMHEHHGRLMQAEEQYRKALKLDPKHLESLLGYARLLNRRDRLNEALELFRQAAETYPEKAALQNDLGLCYARGGLFNEAVSAMTRAIELEPRRPLYRNNIATILVDMGQVDAALAHLRAAHSEAAAEYNLGYLLHKKGLGQAARSHFVKALQLNPSLSQAQAWLERLGPPRPQPVSRRPTRTQTVQGNPAPTPPVATPPTLPPSSGPRLRVSDRRMNGTVASPEPAVRTRGAGLSWESGAAVQRAPGTESFPPLPGQAPIQPALVQPRQAPYHVPSAVRPLSPPPVPSSREWTPSENAPIPSAVYRGGRTSGLYHAAPLPPGTRPEAPLPSQGEPEARLPSPSGDVAPLPPTSPIYPPRG